MKITVILCTYNRCQSLREALGSVAASVLPKDVDWEVLIVDNNSNDQTPGVAADFRRQYPDRFRYVLEATRGKSHALNTAIRSAGGDVLAFMDDDVVVDSMWLQNLTEPLRSGKWAGVGGRILPRWVCRPPAWIPLDEPRILALFAMFDLGLPAGPLQEPPFGTNMAFRKEVFEKYGGFRCDLGPQPGSEIRSEDTEFGRRLLNAGQQFWYAPSAVVHHPVPANRLTQQYFLQWWFDKGRADFREFGSAKDTKWRVAGIPLYMFRRIAKWTLLWMLTFSQPRRFSRKLKVWTVAGGILESYRLSHAPATEPVQLKAQA